jgi:hypothetical protein
MAYSKRHCVDLGVQSFVFRLRQYIELARSGSVRQVIAYVTLTVIRYSKN